MITLDYLKSRIIGSPLEPRLLALKGYVDSIRGRKNPELAEAAREEDAIADILRKCIRPTSNCIDVGCHLGSVLHRMTVLAPEGRHMAFEPSPTKAGWLRKKFPRVDVHCMALGEQAGEVTFFLNRSRSAYSSLTANGDPESDQVEEIRVPCDRLDNLVPADRKIDFLKIDVEGFELPVLRGARQLLARDRPRVLFESMAFHFKRFDYTPRDLHDYLARELNYSIYLFTDYLADGAPLEVDRYVAAHDYPFRAFNFLAAPTP